MNAIKIMGWVLLAGMAWAGGKTPDFLLPQQGRSSALRIETKKGNLRIDGFEVEFEVMPGAAACYRVNDHLFIVQARNFETGGLLLWDSKAQKIRARMTGSYFPALVPIAEKWLAIHKREGDAAIYGVNPSQMEFVRLGPAGFVGGSKERLFFLEQTLELQKPAEPKGPGQSSLTVIESGKEPIKIKVDFGDFRPVGSDSIRGNFLLLIKRLEGEKMEIRTPPQYEVACWDLNEKKLKSLGEVNGTWVEFVGPPPKGGGRRETSWFPYLQIRWLPGDQKKKPNGQNPRYRVHFVDPTNLKITVLEPEALREQK